jgi:hypothetical protein
MTQLAKLTGLKRLNLWRAANLSDAGLEPLAGLTKMEWLNVDNTQLSNDGLAHLAGMKQLKFLHLGSTFVSDAGLVHLEGLAALDKLIVTRTAVTETGVAKLKEKLPDLDVQLKYIEGQ